MQGCAAEREKGGKKEKEPIKDSLRKESRGRRKEGG